MTTASFLADLKSRLSSGPCVLATVMEISGSTPRRVGAQMACGQEWLLGTVGGGAAESKVIDAARAALGSNAPSEVAIDLRGTPDFPKDGICGGTMLVRLDPLECASGIGLDQANSLLAAGGTIKQHFPPEAGWHLEVLDNDEGGAGGKPGEGWFVHPDPILLIVGGGHCGVALARAAASLGFRIIVQDDRSTVAAGSELPDGVIRSCLPVAQALESSEWSGPLYVSLVTRSYKQDIEAIGHLAGMNLTYVGLMGSKRRVNQVIKLLRQREISEEFIDSLDTPIGIDLPVETPEEIAISICARLIQVRQAKQSEILDAVSTVITS